MESARDRGMIGDADIAHADLERRRAADPGLDADDLPDVTSPRDTAPTADETDAEEEEQPEQRVSFTELFFDLVFVFALTEISAVLADDHSAIGVGHAVLVFVPLWWVWVHTTVYANGRDVDTVTNRLAIFALGMCALGMAVAVPHAFGTRAPLFAVSFLVARVLLAFLLMHAVGRFVFGPFFLGAAVSAPLVVVGAVVGGAGQLACWAAAALVELAAPALLRKRLRGFVFEPAHLPERFSLFVIIALGESLVAVGATATALRLSPTRALGLALAFVLACGLWWTYFQFAASAVRHALATARLQAEVVRSVLSYGHLAYACAVMGIAVGLKFVVKHPAVPLATGELWLLTGGCALYLLTFGYTRWRMFGKVAITRIPAGLVCVLIGLTAFALPAVAVLGLVTTVVVALNVAEYFVVKHGLMN